MICCFIDRFLGVIRPLPPSPASAPTSQPFHPLSPTAREAAHDLAALLLLRRDPPPPRALSLPARRLLLAAARLSTPLPRQPLAAGLARTPSVPPAPALPNMALVLAAERGRCCLWALRRQ